MPIRQNAFFNDPALGQAFASLAAAFEPPSGADAAGWAAANAKNAEAKRLADFYASATGMDPAAYDRLGPALGLWTPNQGVGITMREQDLQSADRRYGADQGLAGAQYGADRTYAASTENNVRDNARAVETNAADNARALDVARLGGLAGLFGPVAEGAVRPAITSEVARLYGAPGALPEAQGRAAPLSSDEVIAATMLDQPASVRQSYARDKFLPSETQVQGEERRRLAAGGLLSDEALLDAITGKETPVEAIGADGRATFMSPGAAVRIGAQPAPRSPSTVINTGAAGDGKLREKLDENEGKRWSDLQGAAATASGLQGDLEILSELIDQAPQGPVIGRFNELFPEATTAGAAFQSIIARAAPGLRVEGSGATSDIEYEGMVRSLPRLRNDPEANRLIIEAMRAKAAINMRRGEIVTAYQNNDIDAVTARRQLSDLNRQSVLSPGLRSMVDAAGGGSAPASAAAGPQPGDVEDGYRFRGGDAADPANWELVR